VAGGSHQEGRKALRSVDGRAGGPRTAMIPTGSYATAVTSREVRDLADLGGASRLLGERWEQVGGQAIERVIGQELRAPTGESFRCQTLLRLDIEPGLLPESAGRALKSPDCLFAGHDRNGRLILQPGDFKFTLDVATRDQIEPAPIRALIEHGGPRFQAALARLIVATGVLIEPASVGRWLLDRLDTGQARLLAGFFISPDEPANRLFLRQNGRRRLNPLSEGEVRLLPVAAGHFFGGLPGDQLTPGLRQLDDAGADTGDFAAATYYFQLATAVAGAFQLLHRPLLPLLGPEPKLALDELLAWQIRHQPRRWAIDLTRDLAAPAIQRRERLRLAQRLSSSSLRGRSVYETVEAAGWRLNDEGSGRPLDRTQLRQLLDRVELAHGERLAAMLAAQQQQAPLSDDQAILDWLRQARLPLEEADRALLLQLLTQLA
jgi:hypothetical protein